MERENAYNLAKKNVGKWLPLIHENKNHPFKAPAIEAKDNFVSPSTIVETINPPMKAKLEKVLEESGISSLEQIHV